MAESFDPDKAARYIFQAHAGRAEYRNLPPDIAPLLIPPGTVLKPSTNPQIVG